MNKDFLCLTDWSKADLDQLFALTGDLKARQKRGEPHRLLEGKTLAMIFEKNSTRTRVSFEVGMHQLGGHALFLHSGTTQMGRGEPVRDTGRVMARYCDGIMIRTYSQQAVEELATWSDAPVINGLTDLYHPCQLMADIFTVIEHKGGYQGLTFAWIGDGNNMANSWINAAAVLGFRLWVATPKGYRPDSDVVARAEKLGADLSFTDDPLEAADGADVLSTDVWASMGQEEEAEKRRQAFAGFQLDRRVLDAAAKDAIVLHCLPAHRGEEISDEVIESPQSVVFDEAENRLHAQKAIMATLMG
ncbi:ornithine carbamoyltransferase [Geothermobacter hydrogeniphilus]|uniref:Ornithine carbamoyltransferase n=1 Tax=Geothermobacter hydrogeniphilus TaxID=1969733 RepID=A0A2K2H6R6_9BACT|nr:ornithine carbamoyltransferase [Geothermobacter hydrogeniphilus]PNU19002.1 ornithine carbamoyltransferase [Geothermobacter hydrogeniphilus]